MKKAWQWYRTRGRAKQVIVALVALWLFAVGVSHLGIGGGSDGSKAQARPAPVVASPSPGITRAQARVRARTDDWRLAIAGVYGGGVSRSVYLAANEKETPGYMRHPTFVKVMCSGAAYWKVSYPTPWRVSWYESRARGIMVAYNETCESRSSRRDTVIHRVRR